MLSADARIAMDLWRRGIVPADVIEHVTSAALSDAINRWTGRFTTPVNARLVAEELGAGDELHADHQPLPADLGDAPQPAELRAVRGRIDGTASPDLWRVVLSGTDHRDFCGATSHGLK